MPSNEVPNADNSLMIQIYKDILSPTFRELGDDIRRLYLLKSERLFPYVRRKLSTTPDGNRANERIAHEILIHSAFADSEVCKEYFGGILASSMSENGIADDSMQFLNTVRSLSSKQLEGHYLIYNALNKLLIKQAKEINLNSSTEVYEIELWLTAEEYSVQRGISADLDANALFRIGLVNGFVSDNFVIGQKLIRCINVNATIFGIALYAAAHNELSAWDQFHKVNFGDAPNIAPLKFVALTQEDLQHSLDNDEYIEAK